MAEYKYTAKHATSEGMQSETQWTFYKGQQTNPVFTPNGNGSAFIDTSQYEIVRAYYELEELAAEGIWYYFKSDPNATMRQLSASAGSYNTRTTVDIPVSIWENKQPTTGYNSPFAIVFKPTKYTTQTSQYTRYIRNVKLVVEAQLKASAQTFTIKSVNIGEQQTIVISNESTAVQHKVVWTFSHGSTVVTSGVKTLAASVRSISWAVPQNKVTTICNMFDSSTQRYIDGVATVTTYLNGTQIGSPVSHTARLYMTSAQGAPEMQITKEPVTVHQPKPSGEYVQYFNNLKLSPTVTGKYNATISNITVSTSSKTYTTTSGSDVIIPLTTGGQLKVTVQATDSRGFKTTKVETIDVVSYAAPTLSNVVFFKTSTDTSVTEDDEGEYLYLTARVSRNASSGNNDTFQYSISETGGQQTFISGTMSITWSGKNGTISGHIGDSSHKFDKEKTYTIELTFTDAYSLTATYDGNIQAAIYTIHRQSGGQGVAFGKISELQGVEVNENWPVYVYGKELKKLIVDCANPVGARIVTYDTNFNPNTEWPWTLWALYTTQTSEPVFKTWVRAR